jgi:hypothetical protein
MVRTDEKVQPAHRRSYILRLWCTGDPGAGNWQASLEDPSTRERFGFSSLEQLFAFLMEQSEEDRGGRALSRRSGCTPEESSKEEGR